MLTKWIEERKKEKKERKKERFWDTSLKINRIKKEDREGST